MKGKYNNYNQAVAIAATHFQFEADFMQENIRCIPMIVRFKLDAAGIKLKLTEWSKFNLEERHQLTVQHCNSTDEITAYRNYLLQLVFIRTGSEATDLMVDHFPAWANLGEVHPSLQQKAKEHNWHISVAQWQSLTNLQRFVLLKLYRPGHENKNFPKAMIEFQLV